MEPGADPDWTRIATEAEFRARCVGRSFADGDLEFEISADGTIQGHVGPDVLTGHWHWEDGLFCRLAAIGGEDLGWDREIIEVSGSRMRYIRQAGRGESSVVTALAPLGGAAAIKNPGDPDSS